MELIMAYGMAGVGIIAKAYGRLRTSAKVGFMHGGVFIIWRHWTIVSNGWLSACGFGLLTGDPGVWAGFICEVVIVCTEGLGL
jgi:hypothetical protein